MGTFISVVEAAIRVEKLGGNIQPRRQQRPRVDSCPTVRSCPVVSSTSKILMLSWPRLDPYSPGRMDVNLGAIALVALLWEGVHRLDLVESARFRVLFERRERRIEFVDHVGEAAIGMKVKVPRTGLIV